ncbi:MAG: hypothetical protein COA57_05845 [Flavobacteriales bacterium]|nr:MAG: hypothetical protein COA57_05845 [Flavobacteriales bacterium]
MNFFKTLLLSIGAMVFLSGCTLNSRSYKTPNHHVEFKKADFEFSSPQSAEAKSVTIVGLDFSRLFKKEVGMIDTEVPTSGFSLSSIPIIGSLSKPNRVHSYALYQIMLENPGYDVIFYPRYEVKKTGIPYIFETTIVKATARLGKLK